MKRSESENNILCHKEKYTNLYKKYNQDINQYLSQCRNKYYDINYDKNNRELGNVCLELLCNELVLKDKEYCNKCKELQKQNKIKYVKKIEENKKYCRFKDYYYISSFFTISILFFIFIFLHNYISYNLTIFYKEKYKYEIDEMVIHFVSIVIITVLLKMLYINNAIYIFRNFLDNRYSIKFEIDMDIIKRFRKQIKEDQKNYTFEAPL